MGWGITPLEGNLYISRKFLLTDKFRPNFVPGTLFLQVPVCVVGLKTR